MLIKSLCRIIRLLLIAVFSHLNVTIICWSHKVRSAQSSEVSVNFPPAPDVVNDDHQLADEADQGGGEHHEGPHSEHLTLEELLWAVEIQRLFCQNKSKH